MNRIENAKPVMPLDQWMTENSMSNVELGAALDVTRMTVWRWRNDRSTPPPRHLKTIGILTDHRVVWGLEQ